MTAYTEEVVLEPILPVLVHQGYRILHPGKESVDDLYIVVVVVAGAVVAVAFAVVA